MVNVEVEVFDENTKAVSITRAILPHLGSMHDVELEVRYNILGERLMSRELVWSMVPEKTQSVRLTEDLEALEGLGSLGSLAAKALIRMGVRHLILISQTRLKQSNGEMSWIMNESRRLSEGHAF
jgi:hypothetical protein